MTFFGAMRESDVQVSEFDRVLRLHVISRYAGESVDGISSGAERFSKQQNS